MAKTSTPSASELTERGVAVALITLTRYLAYKDPTLHAYLQASLDHARSSSLSEEDLSVLRLLVGSIGE